MISKFVRGLSLGVMALAIAAPVMAQEYKVLDRWKIGGEGAWDYITADPGAHLLYATHGPRVEVIDTNTGKAVGAITGMKSVHGVTLDEGGKYGYISDGAANEVVIFDRKTFATVAKLPAATNPDGIIYEPVSKTVWTFNGRSSDSTVIDATTNKVVATVKLSGKPEFPAVDGKGFIYVNIETKNSVVKLDGKTHAVVAEWTLTGCESPSGMAIDTAHHRLFSVCDGKKMAVTDYATGKVIANPAIGEGPDAAGFDAKHDVAFSSNGKEGTLTIIDTKTYKVLQTLPTMMGARTMTFDPGTGKAYLIAAELGPRPAATKEMPRPRPSIVPGSYSILVVGRK